MPTRPNQPAAPKLGETSTDAEVLTALGARLARARLTRNLTQADLARDAGVSRATVQRLEAGQSTQLTNLVRVLRTLDLLSRFDNLLAEMPVRPLQQLRRETPRRRASSKGSRANRAAEETPTPWTWGSNPRQANAAEDQPKPKREAPQDKPHEKP